MTWTTTKPTKAGWYWWKEPFANGCFVRVVEIIGYPEGSLYVLGHGALATRDGEWSSEPLEPPVDNGAP